MSYETMLHKVRFEPVGSPLFQGETGDYLLRRMKAMWEAPGGDEEHVRASKAIGWG